MTEKVTIIITTYKRIKSLVDCIESIQKHTNKDSYKIIVMIDNNDTDTFGFMRQLDVPNIKAFMSSDQKDWVGLTNCAIDVCDTEHFVFICDDWLAVEDDWLEKGMATFKEKFPDNNGLLVFNDYIQEKFGFHIKLKDGTKIPMATHGLSSKTFVKEIGDELLYYGYRHYSADCELAIKAHFMGKLYYLKDVMLKHNHHFETGQKDQVYIDSEKENFDRDRALYLIRNGNYL